MGAHPLPPPPPPTPAIARRTATQTPVGTPMAAKSSPARPNAASDDQILRPMIPTLEPAGRRRHHPASSLRLFRSLCRTLPIFTPKVPAPCKVSSSALPAPDGRRTTNLSGRRVSGTLFGPRRGRVSLCVQESPRCLPTVIIELAMQTHVLMREMSMGMVRIALETEKRAEGGARRLMEEPVWSMFCNGKKSGYGLRREATGDDLVVMELLRAVSMGAGVLPGRSEVEGPEAEVAYMRTHFEHVVGSRDSETLYMVGPGHENNGPELTIFLVRV